MNTQNRRLIQTFWVLAVALGVLQTWTVRDTFDADGISYLDLGDACARGDWTATINAHWSPLYPCLLGVTARLTKPTPYWEFTVVHLVNFAIFLLTLFCFNLFLRDLILYNRHIISATPGDENSALPTAAWLALGYSLFISSALVMINIKSVSPDMAVAGLVYLASSILLRIYMRTTGWPIFVLQGIVLGVGYLTKAVMFPLAFVFLSVSLFAVRNFRVAISRVLLASAVFVVMTLPFVTALSQAKGRLTISDSPRLNYAIYVNGVSIYDHWQGEPPGTGKPLHPTRKIFNRPAVYEFGTPIQATYAPWYDPSYWNEGIVLHFDFKQQLWRLAANIMVYLDVLTRPTILMIVGFLLLCMMANKSLTPVKAIADNWVLLVPALLALVMYSLVVVTTRYVGPFLVLLCSGVGCGVRLLNSQSKRLVAQASMATLILVAVSISTDLLQSVTSEFVTKNIQSHLHWYVAEGLKSVGIRRGDKVAFIGDSHFAYWARLARVRISAEIPLRNIDEFVSSDPTVKSEVFKVLAGTGARLVVTDQTAVYASTNGWQRIGNTDHYYVHMLTGLDTENSPRS